MTEPPGHSPHVSASPDGCGRREVAQLVEVGGDAELLGGPPVGVGQSVRDERAGASGNGGQDKRVNHEAGPDHRGIGFLLRSPLSQESEECTVEGDISSLVGLGWSLRPREDRPLQVHGCDQPLCGSTAGSEAASTLDWRRCRVEMAKGDLNGPLVVRAPGRYEARSLRLGVGLEALGLPVLTCWRLSLTSLPDCEREVVDPH